MTEAAWQKGCAVNGSTYRSFPGSGYILTTCQLSSVIRLQPSGYLVLFCNKFSRPYQLFCITQQNHNKRAISLVIFFLQFKFKFCIVEIQLLAIRTHYILVYAMKAHLLDSCVEFHCGYFVRMEARAKKTLTMNCNGKTISEMGSGTKIIDILSDWRCCFMVAIRGCMWFFLFYDVIMSIWTMSLVK